MIFWTLVLLLAVLAGGIIATFVGGIIATLAAAFIGVWLLFALFTLFFFRDPTHTGPSLPNAIVSPAHGKVDAIDETEEPLLRSGTCKRISIFLSLIDVHVQKAPVTGKLVKGVKDSTRSFLPGERLKKTADLTDAVADVDLVSETREAVRKLLDGLEKR